MDKSIIAKNIKYFRTYLDLSQAELANKIGVKRTVITNYETGVSTPNVNKLKALSNCFGVTMDILCEPLDSYENVDKIEISIKESELKKYVFNILFPIFPVEKSNEDVLLKQAYMKHKKIWSKPEIYGTDMELAETYSLYKKSFVSNKALESAANMLSLMFFEFCILFSGDKRVEVAGKYEQLSDIITRSGIGKNTYKKFFIQASENDINKEEKSKYYRVKQAEYLEIQRTLRNSNNYRDIADYYFAMRYLIGFHNNSYGLMTNNLIFYELVSEYAMMGNVYAVKYIENQKDWAKER